MPTTVLSFPSASSNAVPTIIELLDTFLDYAAQSRGRSLNTVRSYRSDLKMLVRKLPQTLDTMTRRDLERMLMARVERPATTNRRIASTKQFFRWCRREGYIERDTAEDLESKTQTESLPLPIPAADLRVLDRAIKSLDRDAVERLVFTILRETGMRDDEVLSLNIGDVILEPGHEALRVVAPKNQHDRITVLTEDLMPGTIKGLKRHLKVRPTAAHTPLFVNRSGRRLTYDVLHTRWQALLIACGLVELEATEGQASQRPRYTIHQLRHTAGSEFIAQLPEEVVSRMLGHADPKSTRIYAELNEDQVRVQLARRRK